MSSIVNYAEHPARLYWEKLGNEFSVDSVNALQLENRRSVYRLTGTAQGDNNQRSSSEVVAQTSIIAKRAPSKDVHHEYRFYASLLPNQSMDSIQVYGLIEDAEQGFSWLFIEDAGVRNYDPKLLLHRKMVAQWLGQLHTKSKPGPRPQGVADKGPKYFSPLVAKAYKTIECNRNHAELTGDDRMLLDQISGFCQTLEFNWAEMTRFCESMPHTLVHGDIKEDNLLVRDRGKDVALAVIDWHEGGWGVPALDLAKFLGYRVAPDFPTYLAIWQDRWPHTRLEDIRRLAYVGEAFRWIASVRWHIDDLSYGCIERAISRMQVYREWMLDIERAAPWRHNKDLAAPDWQPLEKYWS